MASKTPPVVLFGYDSSPFTNKVRLALRVKRIPFTYVPVPSMMPRPILRHTFGLTYRKIPVLAIGRDIYCDTSIIIEALEHFFPEEDGYGTVYPKVPGLEDWVYRGLVRGFVSFWVDRPFFRTTTGLIPPSVWRTHFGIDRAALIGHKLDAEKLGRKVPQNLANLDLHLSLLEPTFTSPPSTTKASSGGSSSKWLMPTPTPSLADLSLYYQLRWGIDIAQGRGIYNLTGGGTHDTSAVDIVSQVFNSQRYPGTWSWFHALETYLSSLPDLETTVNAESDHTCIQNLASRPLLSEEQMMVPTPVDGCPTGLDEQRGLVKGAVVSVAPDDTGRDDPVVGELVGVGVEEVVVKPVERGVLDVRVHFPRVGFVVRVVEGAKL